RRRADKQAQPSAKVARRMSRVDWAVVGEPLDRVRDLSHARAEAALDRLRHQVLDGERGWVVSRRPEGNGLSVAAVQTEGHLDALPVPAANLEGVAAPAQVALEGHHLALVGERWFARMSLQEQPSSVHKPVGPLVIDGSFPLAPTEAIEDGDSPAIPVRAAPA